jgi:hypothetical protein
MCRSWCWTAAKTQLRPAVNVALRKNVAAHHHGFRLTSGLRSRISWTSCTSGYERDLYSYFIVLHRGKSLDVRGVQVCVRKLAANASDSVTSECLVFSIVMRDEVFKAWKYLKAFAGLIFMTFAWKRETSQVNRNVQISGCLSYLHSFIMSNYHRFVFN